MKKIMLLKGLIVLLLSTHNISLFSNEITYEDKIQILCVNDEERHLNSIYSLELWEAYIGYLNYFKYGIEKDKKLNLSEVKKEFNKGFNVVQVDNIKEILTVCEERHPILYPELFYYQDDWVRPVENMENKEVTL